VPRFYFHLCNGSGFTEDREGLELPDDAAARKEAVRGLRDISAGELMRGEMNLGSFVEVEDENHNLLMTIEFGEAVRVSNKRGAQGGDRTFRKAWIPYNQAAEER
jgi:hypothetical protein